MNNNVEDTANDLIDHFSENSETQEKVRKIKNSDPFVELKLNLLDFFKERMSRISTQEKLKEKVETELEVILERGELSFDQLMSLYNAVSKQNHASADSLLSLFRPIPGAPSILAANLSQPNNEDDAINEMYDNLSSDQLQKIDKLNKLLTKLSKTTENEEV